MLQYAYVYLCRAVGRKIKAIQPKMKLLTPYSFTGERTPTSHARFVKRMAMKNLSLQSIHMHV